MLVLSASIALAVLARVPGSPSRLGAQATDSKLWLDEVLGWIDRFIVAQHPRR
jgi:hypothetical protein